MTAPTPLDLKRLARTGLLATLPPAATDRLLAPARVETLARREALFRQGEPTTGFFIVIDGVLKLSRLTCAGEEAVIQILGRGDSVAAASAFVDHRYLVTAEAVTDARVLRIPMEHLFDCITEMTDVARAIMMATAQHLGELVQHVEELKARSGLQRVAEFLASLCPAPSGPCEVMLPYDKILIAGRLGITPESLSRMFAKLKPAGVEVDRARVTIADVGVLHALAAEAEAADVSAPPRREPGVSDLLLRRLRMLDLDVKEISRNEPRTFRELQQTCTICGCQGRCALDLGTASSAWKAYCGNAALLKALHGPG
jgi:CRP-like cAMP-binding protein